MIKTRLRIKDKDFSKIYLLKLDFNLQLITLKPLPPHDLLMCPNFFLPGFNMSYVLRQVFMSLVCSCFCLTVCLCPFVHRYVGLCTRV